MTGDRKEYNRRSIRLKGYDYSRAGAYYVTICVREMRCLLGCIVEGRMTLNGLGRIVLESWEWLAARYDYVKLDHLREYICNNPMRWGDRLHPGRGVGV